MRVDSAHRRIAALPEEVFRAFRDPGLLAAWLPPEGMHAHLEQFDLRAGGGFRSVLTYETHDAPGKYSAHTDVTETKILEMDAPHKIVWSVRFPSEDPSFAGTMFMEWTFEAVLSDDPEQTPGSQVHADLARSSPCRRRMSRRGSTPRNTSPGSSHRCASSPGCSSTARADPGDGLLPERGDEPRLHGGSRVPSVVGKAGVTVHDHDHGRLRVVVVEERGVVARDLAV